MSSPPPEWRELAVDLSGVVDRADLFERFGAGAQLPDWWGRNWDALLDVLTDLSWLEEAKGYVLRLTGGGDVPLEDARVLDAVLDDVAARWAARGVPFVVVR